MSKSRPQWVPDSESPHCTFCLSQFTTEKMITMQKRRHHCRFCGKVFCGNCSKRNALLPEHFGYASTPQRCCDNCYTTLEPLQPHFVSTLAVASKDLVRANEKSINSPLSFSLEAEIKKAVNTVESFCKQSSTNPDRAIPSQLLQDCEGIAFLTVVRAGFLFTGKFGTGLVIAKKPNGQWSPPSAIASVGMGWGAQIGGELTDFMIIIRTKGAINAFAGNASVSLGAGMSIAAGPVGRTAEANVSAGDGGMAACYSYAQSRGLFAGLSLEGSVLAARPDLNENFYGQKIRAKDLLQGSMMAPKAAGILYEALAQMARGAMSGWPSKAITAGPGM